eukprot:3404903-Pleurochrysis_carterae.AAC.1
MPARTHTGMHAYTRPQDRHGSRALHALISRAIVHASNLKSLFCRTVMPYELRLGVVTTLLSLPLKLALILVSLHFALGAHAAALSPFKFDAVRESVAPSRRPSTDAEGFATADESSGAA